MAILRSITMTGCSQIIGRPSPSFALWSIILIFFVLLGQRSAARAQAFGDFTYTTNSSSAAITGYTGPGGDIVIPSTIDNKPITAIGRYAFRYNNRVTGVVMPDNVINISDSAFNGCTNLASILLPNSITNIGSDTFRNCTSLTDIIIPHNVTRLEDFLFTGCTSLTNVIIPDGVIYIGSSVFSHCINLSSLGIPNSVTNIVGAFGASRGATFYGCRGLTNITLPDNIPILGDMLFNGCSGLTKITIPKNVNRIGYGTFLNCTALKSVSIPAGVTNMGGQGFSGCSSLTSVFFEGDAPALVATDLFYKTTNVTVYYRAGTTGWSNTFAGIPTALWIEQPTYQDWARNTGLLDKSPNASGETDDADGDGMSNLAEMLAGTDPISSGSALMFESLSRPDELTDADKTAIGPDQYALYFQAVPGRKYEIQSVTAFGGTWQTETNVTATTTQKRVVVNKPVDQGFYRVVLVP